MPFDAIHEGMYAEVLLPLALPQAYTYGVPVQLQDQVVQGIRVEVPLRNKLYAGLIVKIHSVKPPNRTRNIISILDESPIVNDVQFKFWEWLAAYYCAHLGEVMNVALPTGLKLSSETRLLYNIETDLDAFVLTDDEYMVAEAVSIQNELTIDLIREILDKKTVYPVIKSLLQKGILSIKEELKHRYKVLLEDFVVAKDEYADSPELAINLVSKSEKQTRAVLSYFSLQRKLKRVPKKSIYEMCDVDNSVIKAIAKKGIWEVYEREVSRIDLGSEQYEVSLPPLTPIQERVLEEVEEAHAQSKVALLHGITGSGKTRIYVELIDKVMKAGGQVLYLLPEIALTSQIVGRLKTHLGDNMFVYHSQINENQRVEIWNAALLKDRLFIGARSSLFIPFYNLKLVIIDEEHDSSYKQDSPNPRYQARDSAILLAKLYGASVILGSATPSLESYHNSLIGKYSLINLFERFGDAELPEIEIIDLRDAYKKGLVRDSFSVVLLDAIREVIGRGEQVIIFQNRRGYAPVLKCSMCGWLAECSNCDVSLTYHQKIGELKCHYCGMRTKKKDLCPACGSEEVRLLGLGTEKIEEVLREQIEGITVERFDYDTTRSKKNQEKILTEFKNGQISVLVGTQMITKGFDFENISLVGVINADSLLSYPDFRAAERSFQLMMQVSGRAGRREKKGRVIIQTFSPDHPVIHEVLKADYPGFYRRELDERLKFQYPPFYHLIAIWFRHKDLQKTKRTARSFAERVSVKLGKRLMGPVDPPIIRLRNQYQQVIYIKSEKKPMVISRIKQLILLTRNAIKQDKDLRAVSISIDVDPY